MRSLIIVRTHRADAASLDAFDRLAGVRGVDVVFGLDARQGPIDTGGRPAVAYTLDTLQSMGLYAHPQCGWRCGDYVYYAVRTARPEYDCYWLIEPDVRINVADLSGFFARFQDNASDLLAPRFGPRDTRWEWSGSVARAGLTPHGCVFPITRLSGRAIDVAYEVRRRHSADPTLATPPAWPNDEAFVASALATAGLACADLNDIEPPCYSGASLAIGAVVDFDLVAEQAPDGLIYHPVRDFGEWLARSEARMLQITRRDSDEGRPARLRSEASFLTALAEACLKHPRYEDAALLPLLVVQPRWAARPWSDALPPGDEAADINRGRIAASKLTRRFGVSARAPEVATAHTALSQMRPQNMTVAAPTDFSLGPAFPIGRFPRGAALPYCYDFDADEMLFTLHLRVSDVFAEPFLYAAQRERARAVLRVPFKKLETIFGPPDMQRDPVLIFSVGRTGSTLLERLIGCVTPRSISEPDTISQLGVQRQTLNGLPPSLRQTLLYFGIAPFFESTLDGKADGRCVIKFRSQANSVGKLMAETFPRAKYVFMVRDREAWAKSTFRAFRLRADHAAERLATGIRALHAMRQADIDLTVVSYEDVVADPVNRVTDLMGVAADDALRGRLAAVMEQDSQANHRVSRDRTAEAPEGEADWLTAFEAAWQERRPTQMLAELRLEL